MIDVGALYDFINIFYAFLLLSTVLFGLYSSYRTIALIRRRGQIMGVAGPSALVMSSEYSPQQISRHFIGAFASLNFLGVFNTVGSDISGRNYAFQLASFNSASEPSLVIFGLLYEFIRAYGVFVIFSVVVKFTRNPDPFVQRGESPMTKLALQLVGGFGMVFILEIMDALGSVIKLVPFDAVTQIIRSVQ